MNDQRCTALLKLSVSIFTLIFCLSPFIFMVITSFSKNPDFLSDQVRFYATTDHYGEIFSIGSMHFTDLLRNSLIISTLSAVICTITASLAAYSMSRLPLFGKTIILFFVLTISMFPPISMISYLFKMMAGLGWINTYMALIFPYVAWTIPLSVWILASYFDHIPKNLDKAALVDGCSRWKILYKIIFPIAMPGILSAFLLAFIYAYNEFLFAIILTTDHASRTITVGIALFEGLHGQIPWGNIMAASVVGIVPVVILTMLFQKHIIQGLTRGAVKE